MMENISFKSKIIWKLTTCDFERENLWEDWKRLTFKREKKRKRMRHNIGKLRKSIIQESIGKYSVIAWEENHSNVKVIQSIDCWKSDLWAHLQCNSFLSGWLW